MEKFSVLMSVYIKEKPEYFIESVKSLLNQTLSPDEIIIVIDGPLTPELEKSVSEVCAMSDTIRTVPLEKNGGLGAALNEGLKYCSYDLVARMDTDDIAFPERFEKQVAYMSQHPETDLCSAWMTEFNVSTDNAYCIKKVPETDDEIRIYAKMRNPMNHPAVIFRKHAVIKAGNYQHFPLFEDYYLWIRMMMNGSHLHNIQQSLVWFRVNPEMYKRRGGWKYALDEIKFQKRIRKLGFINFFDFLRNISLRFIVRIIPNDVRAFAYKKIIRK